MFRLMSTTTLFSFAVAGHLRAKVHKENVSHYGDPLARACLTNEMNISVEGIDGWFCSPICTEKPCPTDTPANVTAKPTCDIQDGQTGDMLCGLVCASNETCGQNSTCKPIANTGLCTYDK
tara:strand:+ start:2319 stop:2681 length:363 start_codon:yes stop_codon:yes gene_type:complete